MYIPIILGTGHEGRYTEHTAHFVFGEIQKKDIKTELIDVRNYPSPFTQAPEDLKNFAELKKKITQADGYIIVSPEYNHGYPGELKILLDHFYEEYARKPFAICGVSNGSIGGARMVEQLKQVILAFNAVPINTVVYFSNVESLFDQSGDMTAQDRAIYEKRIAALAEELNWWASALKIARK